MTEPVTLHPVIDPNRCISIGACVTACPEGEILGIVNGRAQLVAPSRCIGHGSCLKACPVDAIFLVFGTATRGVEIPHVNDTFETNVPGIYIAGELGGMGLIRNAVTQGREAVEYIGKSLNGGDSDVLDLVIVGAGPAGLSASLQAKKDGLKVATLDQEEVFGGTILTYPRQKLVMTQEMVIPLYGKFKKREIFKEELLELWQTIILEHDIEITGNQKVEKIVKENGHFRIQTMSAEYRARRVLLTIGRRGSPRKLGVPGEMSSKVAYKLLEPEQYRRKRLLIVGGGDSAVEAALSLSRQDDTIVTLSYRKDVFGRIKEKNRELIEEAIKIGAVDVKFNSQVREIHSDFLRLDMNGESVNIPNDHIFVFIGGEPPTGFLGKIGVKMEMKFGEK